MPPIEAIYQNGVFRPIHPVELPDGVRVEVNVIEQTEPGKEQAQLPGVDERAKAAKPLVGEELAALLDQVAALPYTPDPDGRSDISTRHDDILYPTQQGNHI